MRDQEVAVAWKAPVAELFAKAREKAQVLVLYFGEQADDSALLKGTDLSPLVQDGCVACVRVPRPAQPIAPVRAGLAPLARLQQTDLWQAYGVSKADTFVVVDRYGNEYRRGSSGKLAEAVRGVTKGLKALRARLKAETDTAQAALDAGDVDGALAATRKALKLDVVGYEEAEAALVVYGKLIEKGRAAVVAAGSDQVLLRALCEKWQGTEVQSAAEAALAQLGTSGS